jgi:1,4-alpha-glucan branching enzyme
VVAFDTELFGHFWHEGVTFLEAVLELADVTPVSADAVNGAPDVPPTSWGAGRDLRTWSGELAWIQRRAELRALSGPANPRALRELLALQSSDWAFQLYHGTAGDYPRERAEGHRAAFTRAFAGGLAPDLRNLAPQLANWAFVQP